jgi:hypothetical protein
LTFAVKKCKLQALITIFAKLVKTERAQTVLAQMQNLTVLLRFAIERAFVTLKTVALFQTSLKIRLGKEKFGALVEKIV